jgi:hypothetical protein
VPELLATGPDEVWSWDITKVTLALPAVTGQALADYVRFERRKTTNQAIFVRVLAPHDQPIGPDAIHGVVRDACRRIGLKHGRTHALPSPD